MLRSQVRVAAVVMILAGISGQADAQQATLLGTNDGTIQFLRNGSFECYDSTARSFPPWKLQRLKGNARSRRTQAWPATAE